MTKPGSLLGWINVGSGGLMIGSTWLFAMPTVDARWDIRVTGVITLVAALLAIRLHGRAWSWRWSVVDMFAGIWLLLSTTFVHGDLVAVWSNIALGLLTIGIACGVYDRERRSMSAVA